MHGSPFAPSCNSTALPSIECKLKELISTACKQRIQLYKMAVVSEIKALAKSQNTVASVSLIVCCFKLLQVVHILAFHAKNTVGMYYTFDKVKVLTQHVDGKLIQHHHFLICLLYSMSLIAI